MKLFSAVKAHDFSENTCFLCGANLTDEIRSDEHVIPRWVQHRYNLWDQRITLLNGTSIPYRQLVIPCCRECNNGPLSEVENAVRTALEEGHAGVTQLDPKTVFLWVGKMFFGMMYRELFLPLDRQAPGSLPIVSAEDMQTLQMHHYLLQSSRIPMEFECVDAEHPWTIYFFELQELEDHRRNWDFRDDVHRHTVFLRVGSVGILAAFDGGAISVDAGQSFSRYSEHRLHPLQFEELGAAFFYKASLFDRVPKFLVAEMPDRCQVMVMPIAGLSPKPVFKKGDPNVYAEVLSLFTGAPMEQIYPDQQRIMTWLRRQHDDAFMFMDIEQVPYRGHK